MTQAPVAAAKADGVDQWIRSVEEATIYSRTEWSALQNQITSLLTAYVNTRRNEGSQVLQALLSIFGEDFALENVPDVTFQTELLYEPNMKDQVRVALLSRLRGEVRAWVADTLASKAVASGVPFISYNQAVIETVRESTMAQIAQSPTTPVSDTIAIGLIDVLHRNPELTWQLRSFGGLTLCVPLRRFIWDLSLRTVDAAALNSEVAERVAQRSLLDADHSQLSQLIERIFISISNDKDLIDPAVWVMVHDQTNLCLAVLNRFHIYSGKYGARYCILLLHLIQTFPHQSPANLVAKFASLTAQKQIDVSVQFAPAVISQLGQCDPALLDQLNKISTNAFLTSNMATTGAIRGAKGLPICIDPTAIVVKWMEHAFIGFLKKTVSDWVWDQCMLFGWHCLEPISLELLLLLKSRIMAISSIDELDHVTMTRVAEINLRALQDAFRPHLVLEMGKPLPAHLVIPRPVEDLLKVATDKLRL